MSEVSPRKVAQKKEWTLTAGAFHRLLNWLDQDARSDGLKYLEMRRRLVAYFDRKNCPAPDELADETLNRVARRLEEKNITDSETPAAKYRYINTIKPQHQIAGASRYADRQEVTGVQGKLPRPTEDLT